MINKLNKIYRLIAALCLVVTAHPAGAQAPCPNGDFEDWTSRTYSEPTIGWQTANKLSLSFMDSLTVWPVTGISGQAIHLQTTITGTDIMRAELQLGSIPYNFIYDNTIGGMPYTQIPDALSGYYRYSLPVNDSAYIEVIFKQAGVVLSDDIYKFRGTGSIPTFTAFSMPLSIGLMPDSVIIKASSSNLSGTGIENGSWLELDELTFTGTGITQVIPGGDFDSWMAKTYERPVGWNTQLYEPAGVTRSAIHRSGTYSVELKSEPITPNLLYFHGTVLPSTINTAQFGHEVPLASADSNSIIAGYYMYIPAGTDSGMLSARIYNPAGTLAGSGTYYFKTAAEWTYFEMPLYTVDHLHDLKISLMAFSGDDLAAVPGSVLRLDSLYIKPHAATAINDLSLQGVLINAYPIPAHNELHINAGEAVNEALTIKLFDMTGREIYHYNYEHCPAIITVPLNNLQTGIYTYELHNAYTTKRDKVMKY